MSFSKLEFDWLGYHISKSGISPLERKIAAILTLEAPKTFKKLPSILGLIPYISKFFSNFEQISHPLPPLLKNSSESIWTDVHNICYSEIKDCIANATENSQHNPQL